MILLSVTDFTGFFNIPTSNSRETTTLLQTYIDRYEKTYLCNLMGVELAELFIADLANVTQETRFAVIQDAFYLDDPNTTGVMYESKGLVDMLTGVIFYHFVTERSALLTTNGVSVSVTETGEILSPEGAYRFAERKFNQMLATWEAIQWYIEDYAPSEYPNDADRLYPEFNGQGMDYKFSPIF